MIQQEQINTIISGAQSFNPTLSFYEKRAQQLSQVLDDCAQSMQSIESKECRDALQALFKAMKAQSEDLIAITQQKYNTQALKLATLKWNQSQQQLRQKSDSIRQLNIEDLDKEILSFILEDIKLCFDQAADTLLLDEKQTQLREFLDASLLQIAEIAAQEKIPVCFISYAWGEHHAVKRIHQIAKDLKQAGMNVLLDIWHNKDTDITRFTENVNYGKSDYVLVMGTPSMLQKWDRPKERVLPQELQQIGKRQKDNPEGIIKLLIAGSNNESYPLFLQTQATRDFTDFKRYASSLLELLNERLCATFSAGNLKQIQMIQTEYLKVEMNVLEAASLDELKAQQPAFIKDTKTLSMAQVSVVASQNRSPLYSSSFPQHTAPQNNNNNNATPLSSGATIANSNAQKMVTLNVGNQTGTARTEHSTAETIITASMSEEAFKQSGMNFSNLFG